ncbi:hypothetical protein C8A01DRAFT_34314 [Parachaetomium inaequale]|uniref:NACHT-NTPase and P-loop NTPases N-terminal domain-containing protein n=1 Tax=Parachaetomium inaequale TaxID=2588326 RepID=A0AAN6PIG9_9PEZI|nr:hypothetical protein C8A01DRAFT_34314 [Parachaetomium inaequale]
MEPLSALSLATAVAQFVHYGFKVVENAREIYGSLSGATEENLHLEKATREIQELLERLIPQSSENPTSEEILLANVATECRSLSSQIFALLDKVRAKDPKSKIQSALAAVRSKHHEGEKLKLRRRLEECQAAPNNIKLYVSSREYNVFLNFFDDDKRLRLQDPTLSDTKRYVRDKLEEVGRDHLDRLVELITEKADGIFLWVALVVKAIRTRLEDGYGLSMIEEEVNSLPDELEGLFQRLIDSIRKPYRTRAYQTFAILERVRTAFDKMPDYAPVPFSLLAYSFLDQYDVDKDEHSKSEIRFYNFVVTKGGLLSFEDFVKYCDFANKDAILELCS